MGSEREVMSDGPSRWSFPESEELSFDNLGQEIERMCPSDLASALIADRPYNGQPQTDTGERGKEEVRGITMRDLRDCFIIGAFESSGLSPEDYPPTIYDLPWDDMDVIAVSQNMLCNVEKRMGIYPNVPKLEYRPDA